MCACVRRFWHRESSVRRNRYMIFFSLACFVSMFSIVSKLRFLAKKLRSRFAGQLHELHGKGSIMPSGSSIAPIGAAPTSVTNSMKIVHSQLEMSAVSRTRHALGGLLALFEVPPLCLTRSLCSPLPSCRNTWLVLCRICQWVRASSILPKRAAPTRVSAPVAIAPSESARLCDDRGLERHLHQQVHLGMCRCCRHRFHHWQGRDRRLQPQERQRNAHLAPLCPHGTQLQRNQRSDFVSLPFLLLLERNAPLPSRVFGSVGGDVLREDRRHGPPQAAVG